MIKRNDNENEEQFLWRIGQLKDSGQLDMSWEDIADLMNKEFREDVSDYRSEAAYRKPYQQAKRFIEAGVFDKYEDSDYIAELRDAKHELRKEKQKMFDERTALNKTLRETARVEEDLSKLAALITKNGQTTLPEVHADNINVGDNDLVIALSDFHLGLDVDNAFGEYSGSVAEERLKKYLFEILKIQNTHSAENAYIFLLGDLINGEIHFTTQLENRENVVEQTQKAAELLSAFVYELSKHFKSVYVNGVAGNHSRTSFKDQVLRGNRLDNIIPWYMKAKLAHISNIKFIDAQNYDPTIGCCTIRGNHYLLVHGDFDSYSEKGVSRLVMMLGYKPTAIFYGHLHRCSYDDIAGVKIVRSGSFSGTVDDYTISKRMSGNPTQMVTVVSDDGVVACYPVDLKMRIRNDQE